MITWAFCKDSKQNVTIKLDSLAVLWLGAQQKTLSKAPAVHQTKRVCILVPTSLYRPTVVTSHYWLKIVFKTCIEKSPIYSDYLFLWVGFDREVRLYKVAISQNEPVFLKSIDERSPHLALFLWYHWWELLPVVCIFTMVS